MYSTKEIDEAISELAKQGLPWADIADEIAQEGVDIQTGSYADQKLNKLFNPEYVPVEQNF